LCFFFFNDTATTEIYTLSLHDALPISIEKGRETTLDLSGAWYGCQGYVKNAVKSPSTASFPWFSEKAVRYLGDNVFEVQSYLDAQNEYGATVRTDFMCKVKRSGAINYALEDIKFYQH